MTVANLLMPVAGLIKVEMLFQFVSVSFMFWSNSLIKVETLFYFFSSFSVAFWSIGSSRWNYLFFHLFFPMFTPTQTLSLKFIVIFYPECKYASMCRLGTVERKRTLTHLSSAPRHRCLACWSKWPNGHQTLHPTPPPHGNKAWRPRELERTGQYTIINVCNSILDKLASYTIG